MSAQRSRLTVREYRQVLKVLCNSVELFEIFHEQLEVSHFGSLETYQLIYRVLLNFYSEHSELPTSELMWIEVESLLEDMPEHFSSEEIEELEDFLNHDYVGHSVDEAMYKWASSKIKQLIEEAVLRDNLFTMRSLIYQYTLDKQAAPQDLENLVSEGYIRQLPKDPFTGSNTTSLFYQTRIHMICLVAKLKLYVKPSPLYTINIVVF